MRNTHFKPIRLAACLASLFVLLLTSCKKSDSITDNTPVVSNQRIESLRSSIAGSTGQDISKVVYQASTKSFIVDGDGKIGLADAQLRFPEGTTGAPGAANGVEQRVYPYILTRSNAASISFYVDATVPADWIAALDNAIANWNNAGSYITMKRVSATTTTTTSSTGNGKGKKNNTTTSTSTSVPSYNVLVTTMYDNATSTIAQAYYPDYYGGAGKQVTINTYYNYLSASYKIFAMTHELGHTIGFTHTDGTYGALVSGTPETDPNSVMNSFVLPWNGFTTYDVTAVRTVYPR